MPEPTASKSVAESVLTVDYGDFAGGGGPINSDFDTQWDANAVEISEISDLGTVTITVSIESGDRDGTAPPMVATAADTYFFEFDDPGRGQFRWRGRRHQ